MPKAPMNNETDSDSGKTTSFTPVHEDGWFEETRSYAKGRSDEDTTPRIIDAEFEVIDESDITRPIEPCRFGSLEVVETTSATDADRSKAVTALLPITRRTSRYAGRRSERTEGRSIVDAQQRSKTFEGMPDISGIDVFVNEGASRRTTVDAFSRRTRDRSASRDADVERIPETGTDTETARSRGAHAKQTETSSVGTSLIDMFDSPKGKIAALVVAVLFGIAVGFAVNANATAQEAYRNTIENSEAINETKVAHNALKEDMSVHSHDLSLVYSTVHHDAVTHEVEHPAVYEPVVVHHTVCNECGEAIDGATEEHELSTGHAHFTTEVPTVESVLVSEAWTDTVVDSESYDEQVPDRYVCSGCDEVRYINDAPTLTEQEDVE